MKKALLGKQQGLVFPVMCNAHVKIDYLDNIPDIESDGLTTTDQPYGLWGNTGSFSFDAIITPYDVNGSGAQSTGSRNTSVHDSKKTMPSGSHAYTGVFLNEADVTAPAGANPQTTLTVDGTDATTRFSAGDSIVNGTTGLIIGSISSLSSTSIVLGAASSVAITNNTHLLLRHGTEGDIYLNTENSDSTKIRGNHKMCLFYNTNLKIYLVNSVGSVVESGTYISTTQNNPAAYKLQAVLTTGSTTTTLTSDSAIISPSIKHNILYDTDLQHGGMNADGRFVKNYIDVLLSSTDNRDGTFSASTATKYYLGQELFTRDGFDYTSLGTVTAISSSTITLSATPPSDISLQKIYEHAPREIPYVDNSYHVGVTYTQEGKKLSLFFEGREIKSVNHSDTNIFQLALEDCFIGANNSTTYRNASNYSPVVQSRASANNQFMGAIHEMSMTSLPANSFNGGGSLSPTYEKTLLHLAFEEVDI
mgnify:CR=1 FL=1|tara:strand:- start:1544 stop:2974 length:1431 start_codon:yes stop_codon:yes gene_type:complete